MQAETSGSRHADAVRRAARAISVWLSRPLTPSEQRWSLFTVLAAFVVPLLAFALLGVWNRWPAGDDFSMAASARSHGIWAASVHHYFGWTGRFSYSVVAYAALTQGPLFARFVPAVLLVFWWASLFAVFARLFRGWGASRSLLAGAGASVVIVTTLAVTPTIGQSFYWVIVAPSYVIPFAVFPLLLMWSVCPTGQGNSWTSSRIWLLVSTGIAFVLAGFSETFSLLQVTLLSATVVGFIFWSGRAEGLKRKSVLRLEFALAGAVLGLVALVLAPGNEVRWNSMNIPRPGAFKALYQSFLYVGWWGVTLVVLTPRLFFLVWLFFFALTLGWGGFGSSAPGASWNAKRWASMAFAGPVATAAFVWVGVYPGAYVGGWGPPLRTLIIPTFVLVCGLGLTGFATGRWFAASEMGEKAWWGATSKRLPAAVAASALILSAAFVVRIGQKIPSHRAYATKFDAMDRSARRAKMEGLTRVVIEPLPSFDELGPFGPVRKQTQLDPIGPDSTFWVNRAVSRYYGITVVTSGNPPGP